MSAISLSNIQKTFGANAPVIRNLNLDIGYSDVLAGTVDKKDGGLLFVSSSVKW